MKIFAIALGTVALAVVLVATGVWLGATWTQGRSGYDMMGYNMPYSMMDGGWTDMPCGEGRQEYGMMGSGLMGRGWQDMPCDEAYTTSDGGNVASLDEAQAAVESYVERLGYADDLHVTEIIEFDRNYYAIVAEEETGIGAVELLVDKDTGAVGPEPGPNMMWNAKYGMMGRGSMMGGYTTGDMTLSPEKAQEVAQRWLDANRPGRAAGEADAFYGYYTLHFLNDGEIEGMLSVHGSTGDVWYHSWHGDFVAMAEDHD